ncbi:MAG: indole-3-glycerol phosphate synthase TrpC [Candidatus Omnitrophica bacterium]|nr:indole-3-glycerol phosphate synthase TrpC [Candidatus Omnitrophota bacterium]
MILDEIVEVKKKEVEAAKAEVSLRELSAQTSSFIPEQRSLKGAIYAKDKISLIAEIKKASPSVGVLREEFNPLEIACIYEACGAAALSVLTDKQFFQGDISYLKVAKDVVNIPILRKDFIIDPYQVYESVCAGADAVLLIARILSKEQFKELYSLCTELRIEVLCEVHSKEDLEKIPLEEVEIIGVNNRNLQNFQEDLTLSAQLMKKIPKEKVVVSESGIKTSEDVQYLKGLGVNSVLIGEAFMRSQDIATAVREIMGE